MKNKTFLKVIMIIVLFFIVIPWTFNHVNPWAGVAIFLALVYWGNSYINKFLN